MLEHALNTLLKPANFKRKGNTWYLESEETICLVNLQKSAYGNQYYINLGILVKRIEDIPFPKARQCHIYGRLDDLLENGEDLSNYLDFTDHTISEQSKTDKIVQVLKDRGLELLHKCSEIPNVKDFIQSESSDTFLVRPELRQL